jgi:hypothetical protein
MARSVYQWAAECTDRVQFPIEATDCSLPHNVQTGSGAHPVSCAIASRDCFPGGKAAGT